VEGVAKGKYAGMYAPTRPFTPEERQRMLENMQATYDTFVEKAAQGRNTTPEKIDAIGQGRVWTGRQAKEIGLVDELGGLDRAVALAKQRAKIAQDAEVELVIYPPKKGFFEMMSDPLGASEGATRLASMLGLGNPKVVQALAAPLQLFRRGEPLALMPNVFVR
jgi:protease-4